MHGVGYKHGRKPSREKWETQLLATQVNHSPLGWKERDLRKRQCYWNLGVEFNRIQSHDGSPHG